MSEAGNTGDVNTFMSGGEQATTAPTDANDNKDLAKIARWVAEITLYDRESRTWYQRAKKIVRRYKDERSAAENNTARYNALWSFTQTLQPALYARNPKPDIQRRFKDADPVGRVTSDVLERSVSYFADSDLFFNTTRQTVLDYLLGGRGTVWVRYVPHMRSADIEVTDDAETGEATPAPEVVDFEEVITDFVNVDDFGHNICRTWEELYCVWRKVYMDRQELVERFGEEKGNRVPLDYKQKDDRDNVIDNGVGKATIYELWDKKRKVAVWFHKDIPDALDVREDPLGLDGFFPCPRPLLANLANDSLIPVPFYIEYQDQAVELDTLTSRIASITKSLKFAGVYDASAQGVGRLLSEGIENQLIPVEQWAMFAEKGGLKGVMDFLPIEDVASTILSLYKARDQVKQDLYDITGIADIIRGSSDAQETASAQQIKSNFATMRLSDQQREVQRMVRETIRLMVGVICGHFQLETIKMISGVRLFTTAEKQMVQAKMSGQMAPNVIPMQDPTKGLTQDQIQQMMSDPTWEEVEALIRNKPMRSFRIDIETDSTIKADEEAEKASRIEFLKTIGPLIQQAESVPPEMLPLAVQSIMFAVRAFPVGKEFEGTLNILAAQMEKQAQAMQGKPKPNPEMMKIQGQQQLDQAKMQGEQQLAQAKLQGEMQLANTKAQADIQIEHAKLQAKQASDASEAQQAMITDQRENQMEAAREQAKLQMEERLAMAKIAAESDLQLKIAHIKAASAIEVARITAAADDGAEAEAREVSGE